MCCIMNCFLKFVIGIINALFLIVGVLITTVGGILLAFSNGSGPANKLFDSIKDVLENIQILDYTSSSVDKLEDAGTFRDAGTAFLIVGLFITGIAVIGYCGLSCYTIILRVYLIILIVLLVTQVVLVSLFFTHTLDGAMKSGAMKVIRDHYVDIDHFGLYSVLSNIIMISAECCGVNDYKDFHEAKHWNSTREIIIDPSGASIVANLTTPIACCTTNGTFPKVSVVDFRCADHPNNATSNWYTGCFKKLADYVYDEYRTYAILVATAILLVQALLIVGVILILKSS